MHTLLPSIDRLRLTPPQPTWLIPDPLGRLRLAPLVNLCRRLVQLGCSPAEVDRMDLESGIEWVLMLRES